MKNNYSVEEILGAITASKTETMFAAMFSLLLMLFYLKYQPYNQDGGRSNLAKLQSKMNRP